MSELDEMIFEDVILSINSLALKEVLVKEVWKNPAWHKKVFE